MIRLALLAPIAIAAPAFAQYGPTWTQEEQLPGVETALHYGVFPVDDGGAMTFIGEGAPPADSGFANELVVTRYSPDGAIVWRTREPINPITPSPGLGPATPSIDVRGDGSAAFVVSCFGKLQVLVFAPDGVLLWRGTIQSARSPEYSVSARRPFLDASGELVLATLESKPLIFPPADVEMTSVERFDAGGTSIFRSEFLERIPEAFFGTPSGDVLLITNDTSTSSAPLDRRIQRFDRSGAQVASSTQANNSSLRGAFYDPRTDGALLFTQLPAAGQTLPVQIMVHDAAGLLLATGDAAAIGFLGTNGGVIDTVSGIAYFTGFNGSTPQVLGYDVSATEVVSASLPATIRATLLGLRPGGGVVSVETRSATLNAADLNGAGARLSSTPAAPRNTFSEPSPVFAAGNDGRFWIASALSQPAAPGIQSSNSISQWVEGLPGTGYCPAAANSTGSAGHLVARGSQLAGQNRITLAADSLPPSAFGIFLGSQVQGFFPGARGGQGTLCLGAPIGPFVGAGEIRAVAQNGRTSFELDLTQIPTSTGFAAVTAGQSWNFQLWHRDVNPGPTSNLTNGVSVAFQ